MLKFKIAGNVLIILEGFIEYTQINEGFKEGKSEVVNPKLFGLANTRISTNNIAQKSP